MNNILANLNLVQERICAAALKSQRDPSSIKLLAVSKSQSVEKIRAAYAANQHAFGENYLQEALTKIHVLQDIPLEWHFIGAIQANKTKAIAENFAWVHSIDRTKVAQRLNQQRPPGLGRLNVCIEVNISGELNKSGVPVTEVESIVTEVSMLENLHCRGLMVIPAMTKDFAQQLAVYREVAALQQKLNGLGFPLDTLSMGMSNDFEAAIAAGSTMVRIGTALFGPRAD